MSSKGFAARAQSAGDRNNASFINKQSNTGSRGSGNYNNGSPSGGTKGGQGSDGVRK